MILWKVPGIVRKDLKNQDNLQQSEYTDRPSDAQVSNTGVTQSRRATCSIYNIHNLCNQVKCQDKISPQRLFDQISIETSEPNININKNKI